jgi:hypothetical protein
LVLVEINRVHDVCGDACLGRSEVRSEEGGSLCLGHGKLEWYFRAARALAEMAVAYGLEADGIEVGFGDEGFKVLDH